ncbi:MAG: MCE family protein [Geminicoccaceae bacterium]|nr:MCE family protein [Geminicoccaceae bacterium]
METRASNLAVGVFVLILSLGTAVTALWLARTRADADLAAYEVAFSGSVSGLRQGAAVLYRGVPVGRVGTIRIDPDDVGRILVGVEIEADTPVKTDTKAELVLQGVTGLSNVELSGGSNASPPLEATGDEALPVIEAGPSTIERVFNSTPELLGQAAAVLANLGRLTSDANMAKVEGMLANVEAVTGEIAGRRGDLGRMIESGAGAMTKVEATADSLDATLARVGDLAGQLAQTLKGVREQSGSTIKELEQTSLAFRNLAGRADRTLASLQQPIDDFGQSGLYDFSQMVRETRQLVASLNRISTEIERDPAGFLLGGSQRGFKP